jgi:hypothetical protein
MIFTRFWNTCVKNLQFMLQIERYGPIFCGLEWYKAQVGSIGNIVWMENWPNIKYLILKLVQANIKVIFICVVSHFGEAIVFTENFLQLIFFSHWS